MTKALYMDPKAVRGPETPIRVPEIPVNTYQKTVKDELGSFTTAEFMNIYRDMCYIREFETMLNLIKTTGEYQGVSYNHPGPAHLGIGQEAAYVGEAFRLTQKDLTFGSHRSHGEILAKGLRSIEIMEEGELLSVMEGFFGGKTYGVIKDEGKSLREQGIDFLLYGMMCETFARENGFNKGLGGSMHAFFTPLGIYPNNAIVGGSGTISVGAALYKLVNDKEGVVVCNIGDGSTACGPVWEGFMLAAMDQIKLLWPEGKRALPIIFNINDNFYGMGGQTRGETMGYDMVARIAAGISPDALHAERIDGYNPLAVIDAYTRKLPVAKSEGPVLLDVVTYRISGHSPSDSSSYRTKEEIEARYEILLENYCKVLNIEGLTMLDMAKKDIFPAVSAYSGALSKNALAKKELSSSISCESEIALIEKLSKLSSCLMKSADELENALMCAAECGDIRATAEYYRDQVIPRMQELRAVGDQIEVNLGEEYLPYPTYGQLLFSVS